MTICLLGMISRWHLHTRELGCHLSLWRFSPLLFRRCFCLKNGFLNAVFWELEEFAGPKRTSGDLGFQDQPLEIQTPKPKPKPKPMPKLSKANVAAFTPVKVTDGTRCLARVWAGGHGGQCSWPPAEGQHLCRRHLNNSAHGLLGD